MCRFWMTEGGSKNSWSGGSLSASGFSTVKANSNFAINKRKGEEKGDFFCRYNFNVL